jgi:hypothetical protein
VLFDDCNGYNPVPDYLTYYGGLSTHDLMDCYNQQRPLGMTDVQFIDFKDSLLAALLHDGLTPSKCDVRLKGSSANFYSGWHKLMPYHREVLRELYFKSYGQNATPADLNSIDAEISKAFPNKFLRPVRRPFDSMTRIGVSPTVRDNLSDYDVQVSSPEIESRVTAKAAALGKPPVEKPEYGFYDETIVDIVCHQLQTQWPFSQSNKLQRGVNVKTFSATGPPNQTARIGNLSSHFLPTGPGYDWRIP